MQRHGRRGGATLGVAKTSRCPGGRPLGLMDGLRLSGSSDRNCRGYPTARTACSLDSMSNQRARQIGRRVRPGGNRLRALRALLIQRRENQHDRGIPPSPVRFSAACFPSASRQVPPSADVRRAAGRCSVHDACGRDSGTRHCPLAGCGTRQPIPGNRVRASRVGNGAALTPWRCVFARASDLRGNRWNAARLIIGLPLQLV